MVLAVGAISGLALFWSSSAETEQSVRTTKTERAVSIVKSVDQESRPIDAQPIMARAEAGLPLKAIVDAAFGEAAVQSTAQLGTAPAVSGEGSAGSQKAMALAKLAGNALRQPDTTAGVQAQPAVAPAAPVQPKQVASAVGSAVPQPQEPPAEARPADSKVWLVVTGTRVNMRDAPGVEGSKVAMFENGTKLERLEKSGIWVRVQNPDTSESGWMHGDFLAAVTPPTNAVTPDRNVPVQAALATPPAAVAPIQTAALDPTAQPRATVGSVKPLKDSHETAGRLHKVLVETEPFAKKAQDMSGKYLKRYDNQSASDTWIKKRVMGFSVPVRVNQSQARALILKEMGDDQKLRSLQDTLKRKNNQISKMYGQVRKHLKPDVQEKLDALNKQSQAINSSFRRARDKLIVFGEKIKEEYGCCQYPPESTLKRLHRLAASMRKRRQAAIDKAGEFPTALRAALESPTTLQASLQ